MICLFLAPGFEEVEALTPLDLLRRAGLTVTTVAITTPAGLPADTSAVTGTHGITVLADMTEAAFTAAMTASPVSMEAVILPGGMPGAAHLDASPAVEAALHMAATQRTVIAAICAAPMVPGKRGYLRGRRATCFPGFEGELVGAEVGGKVIRDEREGSYTAVTAAGMGVAQGFGLELVCLLTSPETASRIAAAIQAL